MQVFTFALKPLATLRPPVLDSSQQHQQQQELEQAQQVTTNAHLGARSASGWELQLIMEFCEEVRGMVQGCFSLPGRRRCVLAA